MNAIQNREFEKLDYVDPEQLRRAGERTVVAILEKDESVSHLTGDEKKLYLEKHHAACLALMVPGSFGKSTVHATQLKNHKYIDCVFRSSDEKGKSVFAPFQLKQVVSHEFDNRTELQAEINKLKKYSAGGAVSLWINRDIKIDLCKVNFGGLNFYQLWFFGGSPSGVWLLHGGTLQAWRDGICFEVTMKPGNLPTTRRVRFKPCQSSQSG